MPLIQNWEGEINLTAEQQIFSVLSWLIVLTLLQLSVYPSLKKTFKSFAFPVSFSASLLGFTILSWYCGLLRIPVQIALLPFLGLFCYHLYHRHYSLGELRTEWRWELVFLVFFFLMLDVRFVNPTISYAEKFMDHAFLASVMRNPVVPPLDPWFAGGSLNVYYYLGYWMFGCLGIVTGVPSNIVFNLALPTIFSLAAINLYAIGTLLLEKLRWLPLLILFIPNPSFFYQIAQGKALNTVFWDSTRTISNTINEYPLFSFVWGDVHAHVVSLFNQVFLIFLLLYACKRWESLEDPAKWLLCILCALSLGSMPLFNTWDVLIYAPIMLLFGILIIQRVRKKTNSFSLWWHLAAVPPLAVLFYLPFYLQLKTTTGGISIVHIPSNPFEFLLVNGLFIAIFFAFLWRDMVKRPYLLLVVIPFVLTGYIAAAIAAIPLIYFIAREHHKLSEILASTGLILLIFCEIFYLKDNMGDTYFRMNTVFKCYLPVWIILGIAATTMIGKWLSECRWIPVISARNTAIITIMVFGMLFVLPFIIPFTLSYGTGTLDGLVYLRDSHAGDAGGVAYLRTLQGDLRIVEAEGGDYTYYSRISSFTGIPAIIGMPFHEYMWRGDDTGWFSTRPADVKSIYEDPQKTVELMKKYNATLLYIGDSERERYQVNISANGLEKIYSANGAEIYRITA
jgi:YYY domain-containing protein